MRWVSENTAFFLAELRWVSQNTAFSLRRIALGFSKYRVFLEANCVGFLRIPRFPLSELRWVFAKQGIFLVENCVGFRKTRQISEREMRWVSSPVMQKKPFKKLEISQNLEMNQKNPA